MNRLTTFGCVAIAGVAALGGVGGAIKNGKLFPPDYGIYLQRAAQPKPPSASPVVAEITPGENVLPAAHLKQMLETVTPKGGDGAEIELTPPNEMRGHGERVELNKRDHGCATPLNKEEAARTGIPAFTESQFDHFKSLLSLSSTTQAQVHKALGDPFCVGKTGIEYFAPEQSFDRADEVLAISYSNGIVERHEWKKPPPPPKAKEKIPKKKGK